MSKKVIEKFGDSFYSYNFIEPSAGNGSFFKLLPKDKVVGIDIEPKLDEIIEADFLKWYPHSNNNITIGNPPFGLRGNLALKFINHAAKFSDYVCFILPQLFNSEGKGSCKKRVKGLNLIHTEDIGSTYFFPSGIEVKVNAVFQVWSKNHKVNQDKVDVSEYIKIFSLSDGNIFVDSNNIGIIGVSSFSTSTTRCFLLKNVFRYGAVWHQSHMRMAVVRDLRNQLFEKSLNLPLSFYTDEKKGDLMARMQSDVGEIEVAVVYVLEFIFREPIAIIITVATLFYLSPQLTIFSFILLLKLKSVLLSLVN
jgi:ABC-type multidrug transport system fused ATPase/permease subunit